MRYVSKYILNYPGVQQLPGSDLEGHFGAKRLAGCIVAAGDCSPYSVLHHVTVKISPTAVTDTHISGSPSFLLFQCSYISVISENPLES